MVCLPFVAIWDSISAWNLYVVRFVSLFVVVNVFICLLVGGVCSGGGDCCAVVNGGWEVVWTHSCVFLCVMVLNCVFQSLSCGPEVQFSSEWGDCVCWWNWCGYAQRLVCRDGLGDVDAWCWLRRRRWTPTVA